MRSVGVRISWWQVFLTMRGMIAVINSVRVGVFVGLLVYGLFTECEYERNSYGKLSITVSLLLRPLLYHAMR